MLIANASVLYEVVADQQNLLKIVNEDPIPWEQLSNGGFNQNPFKGELLTWANKHEPKITMVLWNVDCCPPPFTIPENANAKTRFVMKKEQYKTAADCIFAFLRSHELLSTSAALVRFYAYSEKE